MEPTTSFGVIPEKEPGAWRGIAAVDPVVNCAPCADLMAVHATAQWLVLRAIDPYRAAAGAADGKGLSIRQSVTALKALYPELAAEVEVHEYVSGGITGAEVAQLVAQRRIAASCSVLAGKLPWHGTYVSQHRIALAGKGGGIVAGDPLKDAFSNWLPITSTALAAAIDAYPKGVGGGVILFPTVDTAFTTHPLYESPAAARDAGYQAGKSAALAAVQGI